MKVQTTVTDNSLKMLTPKHNYTTRSINFLGTTGRTPITDRFMQTVGNRNNRAVKSHEILMFVPKKMPNNGVMSPS